MAKQEQPAIIRAALHFRAQLIKGNVKASRQIVDAYLAAYKNIKPELDLVSKAIDQQIAAGADPSSQLIYEKGRLQRILSTVATEIQTVVEKSASIVTDQQRAAVDQALNDAKVLSELARDPSLPWPPPAGITGPTWSNINTGHLTNLVGIAGDGSPLHTLLGELVPDGVQQAKNMLVSHVTLGRTATQIAQGMHDMLGASMARSLAVARTETMRSYRVATQESFKENDDVIAKWRWVAQLSYSTCIACISKHGQEFPLTQPMDSHVNCRCIQVPVTKTFAQLGAKGVGETDTSIQTGKDWFNEQPEEVQRKVLGPGKYDAWREGKISIDDMVKYSHSDDWGGSYHEASLKSALAKAEKRGGTNPIPPPSPVPLAKKQPLTVSTAEPQSIKPITASVPAKRQPVTPESRAKSLSLSNQTKSGIKKSVDHAVDRIDSVLNLPEHPAIPIRQNNRKSSNGIFVSNRRGAAEIQISRNGETRELTFTHEFGHYVHHTMLGEKGFTSLSDKTFLNLKGKIENSDAVKTIRAQLKSGFFDFEVDGKTKKYPVNDKVQKYFGDEYLLSEKETFARSFAQYISTKTGDSTMRQQFGAIVKEPSLTRCRQWSDEDFAPIAKEYDKIFKKAGMLK